MKVSVQDFPVPRNRKFRKLTIVDEEGKELYRMTLGEYQIRYDQVKEKSLSDMPKYVNHANLVYRLLVQHRLKGGKL